MTGGGKSRFLETTKQMIRNIEELKWEISPHLERYRILGLGEKHPGVEGSFIIPVHTMERGKRKCHVVTRPFSLNRGRGTPQVAAMMTVVDDEGELHRPTIFEVWKIANRLVMARVEDDGVYRVGVGEKRRLHRGQNLSAAALRGIGAIKVFDGESILRLNDVDFDHVNGTIDETFSHVVGYHVAGFAFFNVIIKHWITAWGGDR